MLSMLDMIFEVDKQELQSIVNWLNMLKCGWLGMCPNNCGYRLS
jgi:hypothetical protein